MGILILIVIFEEGAKRNSSKLLYARRNQLTFPRVPLYLLANPVPLEPNRKKLLDSNGLHNLSYIYRNCTPNSVYVQSCGALAVIWFLCMGGYPFLPDKG